VGVTNLRSNEEWRAINSPLYLRVESKVIVLVSSFYSTVDVSGVPNMHVLLIISETVWVVASHGSIARTHRGLAHAMKR
jgi:hypothetical protein